jgi:hypothetical protein
MSGCHFLAFFISASSCINLKKWRIQATGTEYDNAPAKRKTIFNHKIKSEYHG